MAFSHGSNDAQKSMGVISLALVSYGAMPVFHIPVWVIFACATAMALGTAMGGWRIIKTVGSDFVELQPVHGFCAETSSSAVILTATAMGVRSAPPTSSPRRSLGWDFPRGGRR